MAEPQDMDRPVSFSQERVPLEDEKEAALLEAGALAPPPTGAFARRPSVSVSGLRDASEVHRDFVRRHSRSSVLPGSNVFDGGLHVGSVPRAATMDLPLVRSRAHRRADHQLACRSACLSCLHARTPLESQPIVWHAAEWVVPLTQRRGAQMDSQHLNFIQKIAEGNDSVVRTRLLWASRHDVRLLNAGFRHSRPQVFRLCYDQKLYCAKYIKDGYPRGMVDFFKELAVRSASTLGAQRADR
jgi:hypothetical protein